MVNFGNSWDNVLKGEFDKPYYQQLRKFLLKEYSTCTVYPGMYDIFNAMKYTPYEKVRAVIIGQDPYHGEGQAHGLCFSVKKGVMPAGESYKATDWYKFKVTNRKVLNLEIETAGTGYFDFYLYGPSYTKGIKICSLKNSSGAYYSINTRTYGKTKVKTGTYYIKAVRSKSTTASKKGSGIYSIKWYLN